MSSTVTASYPRSANSEIAVCWISRALRSRRCSRSSTPERVAFSAVIAAQDREVAGSACGEARVPPLEALADVGQARLDQPVEITRGEHEELVVEDRLVHDVGHLRRRR